MTKKAPVLVTLRSEVEVQASPVTLGIVAEISGPQEKIEALRSVLLGRAPIPGHCRRITQGYVKLRLRAAGLRCEGLEFAGPEAVLVRCPACAAEAKVGAATSRGASKRGALRGRDARAAGRNLPPIVVKRGQLLQIHVQYGLVEVLAEGRAEEEGRVGDVIQAQVGPARHKILVRLTGPGSAEVVH